MYDLRYNKPQALLNNMGASCIAAFDNTGEVFVVACSEQRSIALYATASPDGVSCASLSRDHP